MFESAEHQEIRFGIIAMERAKANLGAVLIFWSPTISKRHYILSRYVEYSTFQTIQRSFELKILGP